MALPRRFPPKPAPKARAAPFPVIYNSPALLMLGSSIQQERRRKRVFVLQSRRGEREREKKKMCNSRECKWEATFKAMQLQKKSAAAAAVAQPCREQHNGQLRRRLEGPAAASIAKAVELRKCAREAERAEKLMLLVCWGPN